MKRLYLLTLFILSGYLLHAQTITEVTSLKAYPMLNNRGTKTSVIIDGRTQAMFDSVHIQNAVNINAYTEKAGEQLAEYIDKEQIVVYCTNSNRSKVIIEKLKELGYEGEIVFITDGINGWKAAGYHVVKTGLVSDLTEEKDPVTKHSSRLKPIIQVFGTAQYDIEKNHYGYIFGRAHLGFQYQFDQNWRAKMIIDRGRATSVGTITVTDSTGNQLQVQNTSKEGAYYTMFLKLANLQWKVNENLMLEGGAILQNHYITQERFWGFRYIAQTFQDLYWKIPSSDLGFMAYYQINHVFSFDAALTNGEGPRVNQDAFGKVKFAGGLDIVPSEKIQTRIYYHNKQAGLDSSGTEQLFSVFAGYKPTDKIRVGGEFNYMDNLSNTPDLDSYGFSFYAAYHIIDNTQFFVRYDHLVYDTDSDEMNSIKDNGNTLMGGLSYAPVRGVNLSLNYQGWLPESENNNQENNIFFSMEYNF